MMRHVVLLSVILASLEITRSFAVPIVTGDKCWIDDRNFGVVAGDTTKYRWFTVSGEFVMPCPVGTYFNLTECGCVNSYVPVRPAVQPPLCVGFESMTQNDVWGFNDGNVWVGNHGDTWDSVHVMPSFADCREGQRCGQFSGKSYLSLPALSSAFASPGYNTFSVSVWFKVSDNETGGLLTNGGINPCQKQPTLTVVRGSDDSITANVGTTDGARILTGKFQSHMSLPGGWSNVLLTKSGKVIRMFLNGFLVDSKKDAGDLSQSECPMYFGVDHNGQYFNGRMDQICFYKTAIYPADL